MEAKAVSRYVGTSPRKMRLVIDLIRGKAVGDAMNILHFQPKHAARFFDLQYQTFRIRMPMPALALTTLL
jgi:ribosomal protein L22